MKIALWTTTNSPTTLDGVISGVTVGGPSLGGLVRSPPGPHVDVWRGIAVRVQTISRHTE